MIVFGFLLTVLILDGIFLTVIILLQAGKGGGLAAMGGGGGGTMADNLIGGRQAATLLTKATWTGGAIFLSLALVLSVMSSRAAGPESILRDEFDTAPTPIAPTPLPGTEPGAEPTAPPTGGGETGETGAGGTDEPPAAPPGG